jgi:excisionase family DNA binding protein
MLTVRQAAEELRVSPQLVYTLCARKRIRHLRHGLGRGTIRIPEDALEEYRRSATVREERGTALPSPAKKFPCDGPFTMLDSGRLLEAWRRQGVLGDPRDGDSARSSE